MADAPAATSATTAVGTNKPALKVTPITAADLPAVGQFLHEHLNRRFTPERWIESLTHRWAAEVPNHGMQLRDSEQLVGVFCAIYSDQLIDGRIERFCNPHSWCVLESHRRHSIGLLLQLLRQKGYHFTMFTPNPKVAEVFRGLKFKRSGRAGCWVLSQPAELGGQVLRGGRFAVSQARADRGYGCTGQAALAEYEAHRSYSPGCDFSCLWSAGRGTCLGDLQTRTHFKRTALRLGDACEQPRLVFQRHGGTAAPRTCCWPTAWHHDRASSSAGSADRSPRKPGHCLPLKRGPSPSSFRARRWQDGRHPRCLQRADGARRGALVAPNRGAAQRLSRSAAQPLNQPQQRSCCAGQLPLPALRKGVVGAGDVHALHARAARAALAQAC